MHGGSSRRPKAAPAVGTPAAPAASPDGLAFDSKGDLFAANALGNSITESTFTGAGTFGAGKIGGTLNTPTFLAFGPPRPPPCRKCPGRSASACCSCWGRAGP